MKHLTFRRVMIHLIWRLNRIGVLHRMPDKIYLKLMYRVMLSKPLDLNNPKSFNEKLQWLKLNDRKDIYTIFVDKYKVKEYIKKVLGEEFVIPTIGVWDSFDDIDFDSLPDQFVLKCSHDSGGIVICRDKKCLDKKVAKKKMMETLNANYYYHGREWPYKNVKPRIIAEPFMVDYNSPNKGLTDYKFYCFNGEPKYLYVSVGLDNHETARIGFLTIDWKLAPFKRNDYLPLEDLPQKPIHYSEMVEIAKKLSQGIRFTRIDLYEINGYIYFSEITMHPCSGFMPFEPEEYDMILGKEIAID